jgi:uncharacterized protein with ACT and thioredoxin-like domain
MSKVIHIDKKTKIECLKEIAGATGSTIYEDIADEYINALRQTHGKHAVFYFEPLSKSDMAELIVFIESDE